jgi:hypothetical protein
MTEERGARASEELQRVSEELKRSLTESVASLERLPREESRKPEPLPAAPSVPRYYETTLFDVPGSGVELRAISLPQPPHLAARWQLSGGSDKPDLERIASDLGISRFEPVAASDLPLALLATQRPPTQGRQLRISKEVGEGPTRFTSASSLAWARREVKTEARAGYFCSKVALEALIPIEESAPRGRSLASLAEQAGSAGLGVGYFVAGGSPVVVVYVAAGLVVVGAASGIARGLQEGLHVKLVRWLTGESPRKELEPAAPE